MRSHKVVVSLVVLSPLWAVTPSAAQSSVYTDYSVAKVVSFNKTMAVGVTDTFYVTLPQAPGYTGGSSLKADTSTVLNPPDYVQFSGRIGVRLSRTSGNANDSLRLKLKGLDKDGNIISGPDSSNVIAAFTSGTNSPAFAISDYKVANTVFSPSVKGFAVIFTHGDLAGGSRRFRFDISFQ